MSIEKTLGENLYKYAKCRHTTDKEKEDYWDQFKWHVEFELDFFSDTDARKDFLNFLAKMHGMEGISPIAEKKSIDPLIYLIAE